MSRATEGVLAGDGSEARTSSRGPSMRGNPANAINYIRKKHEYFDGRNATKYLQAFSLAMRAEFISNGEMVQRFPGMCTDRVYPRIIAFAQESEGDWNRFQEMLKEEFAMEDEDRATLQGFEEWIHGQKSGMGPAQILVEFENRYDALPGDEKDTISAAAKVKYLMVAFKTSAKRC
jgi:hypothetical protein